MAKYFKDRMCVDEETFNLAFGIIVAGLTSLVIITLIIIAALWCDNKRRKQLYKRRYQKSTKVELQSSDDLARAFTYVAFLLKNGHLDKASKKFSPPADPNSLLDDRSLEENRRSVVGQIKLFYDLVDSNVIKDADQPPNADIDFDSENHTKASLKSKK